MRLALAFAACAVAFRAPTPPLRQRVTLRAASLDEIRKMRASAIQQELRAAGVRYDDCFEKDELAKRLLAFKNGEDVPKSAPAPAPAPAPTPRPAAAPKTRRRPEDEDVIDVSSYKAPPSQKTAPPPADFDAEAEMANASKLRIKELQAALGRMGVSTRGMLEKAELVDAYVGALRDGKRPDAAAAGDDVFDDDVVELKTSKMPKAGGGPQQQPAGGSPFGGGAPGGSPFGGGAPGGSPFGGGGGNPFGGGAGGMPNIADIFSGMGGGGMGGNPFGGMGGGGGGMGGVQELLQKAMGNPKVMAAVQKAAGNPKVMAAVQDVMQNGPGAMKKYENDREVKAILDELKGIL